MSDEPTAIRFTRRTYKELVDGTLRVQVDIDREFKATFLKMFPEVDMPGAMTALVPEYQQAKPGIDGYEERAERPAGWGGLGPLCQSAVLVCQEPAFQSYVASDLKLPLNECDAEEYLKAWCGVESRKELDSNEDAARRFRELMGKYREWNGGDLE